MSVPFDARAAAAEVGRLSQSAARLQGRRDGLVAREEELRKGVGLAKGRISLKGEVQAFLDQLQEEHNRKNVASFEALLTALAGEVLPGVDPIRLELSTERGLPALDIGVQRPTGEREDVFEDQGGALTNVIGAGLRLVAVVKSNLGRFVVLDEADCWIRPDRVPAFYRVMEDAANRLDVQCLAISHHDISSFESSIRVCPINGTPLQGVTVSNPTPEPEWEEGQKGFRYIRLVDVQAYKDAVIMLSPGVNAITGPNNYGKSTFARALRAVFLGEARDSLVRHGASKCTVEIGVEGNRVLRFVRQPRKTPVNTWSLHEADGSIVVEDGVRHETVKGMPAWVGQRFGILPIQDLDAHIGRQKSPVFLLDDPASKRASVLSVGQESDYVRSMIALHKEQNARDASTVREGEREIAAGRDALTRLGAIEEIPGALDALRASLSAIEASGAELGAAEACLARLRDSEAALERGRVALSALSSLPDEAGIEALRADIREGIEREALADRIDGISHGWRLAYARAEVLDALPAEMPGLVVDTESMLSAGLAVHNSKVALAKAASTRQALEGLPDTMPALAATREAEEALARIAQAADLGAKAAREVEDIDVRIGAVRDRLETLYEAMGGHCPTCGQAVADPSLLLGGHVHA